MKEVDNIELKDGIFMDKYLDARGKQCPIPVIETIKLLGTLNEGEVARVSVDNEIAVQNLRKMAEQKGLEFSFEKRNEDDFLVELVSNGRLELEGDIQCNTFDVDEEVASPSRNVVVLSADTMGTGEEELGKLLMKGFVYALRNTSPLPYAVIMYNSGAKLAIGSSAALEDLKALEEEGVKIMTCGTCLDYYKIKDELAVGEVVNMYVICQTLTEAKKVIRP